MARLRRNAGWLGFGTILCLVPIGIWFIAPRESTGAVVMQQYPELDEAAADRIDELRRATGFDDDVLAATNGTSQELETVLAALRSWYENNSSDLASRQSAIADQRARIRHLETARNNGQEVSAELDAARTTLDRLTSAHETYLSSARSGWLSTLSGQQRAMADQMRSNTSLPMPYRVLALSDAQAKQLMQARRNYRQRLAVTRDPAGRRTQRQEFNQDMTAAIGAGNVQALSDLNAYLGEASQRVVAAVNYVLPREYEE